MLHLSSFLDSLKWSWIKRITNKNTANWKNIPLFEIQKTKLGLDTEMQLHNQVIQ